MAFIQIQLRRGTALEWSSANPILALAEIGVEIDTKQFKFGDGATPWNGLSYGGLQGPTGPGLIIKDQLPSVEDLPTVGNTIGDAYLVNGILYIWDGLLWENVGPLRGPTGFTGSTGPTGFTGSAGAAQGTTITLSAVSPGNVNGWYITGTGIAAGAQIVSGAGTNTLTVSVPHTGTVSGTITCTAWNTSLIGRRIKIQSGATGLNQELIITGVTPSTGTITFATATAPVAGAAVYSILSQRVRGPACYLNWIYGNSQITEKGKYLICSAGGAIAGSVNWEKLDLTTDQVSIITTSPAAETLTTGSMYAYDGENRIYFTKEVTNRVYYIDVNTGFIYGAGIFPYVSGTAGIGNRMEIITTTDGLKYIWLNRQGQVETYRQLIFY